MNRFAEVTVIDVQCAGGKPGADVVHRSRRSVCPRLRRGTATGDDRGDAVLCDHPRGGCLRSGDATRTQAAIEARANAAERLLRSSAQTYLLRADHYGTLINHADPVLAYS